MSEAYPHIIDFLKVREVCFFCGAKLWCRLANFMGLKEDALPILNAPLKDDHFTFHLDRTTPDYIVKAAGIIDAKTNAMAITLDDSSSTSSIDHQVAKQTFLDLKPYVQLYCPKKSCPQEYTVMSDTFKIEQAGSEWSISPFKLYLESFVTGTLWICNDYIQNTTYIESRNNDSANPIMVPMLDFEAMGSKKLLTRVKPIAVFS